MTFYKNNVINAKRIKLQVKGLSVAGKKGKKILLIEDSPEVVELFRGFLEDDICLVSASDAEEARKILAESYKDFDFIFIDALLPPSGLSSSLQLVHDWRRDCPAVLVAISANMEYALMLRSVGCHRWLEKDSGIGERVNNIINES